MMTTEAPDDLVHPRTVIAAFFDEHTVVHYLGPAIIDRRDRTSIRHLRQYVAVAARHGQPDPSRHRRLEALYVWYLSLGLHGLNPIYSADFGGPCCFIAMCTFPLGSLLKPS
jgi:hypothetical protein